ncbi:hypothetical protein CDCA_CDCA06G1733 [Cyanidium caldarium]|uniref:Probable ATP-dependent transporter ycf16 n=1 Tax=Cyanidium caldarium TaxID=2771 RepID=A0AAV9ITU8_CYACA|nr:hypothetical protein CDCA_CDCA06G1733 [Cyanidium caldarium]
MDAAPVEQAPPAHSAPTDDAEDFTQEPSTEGLLASQFRGLLIKTYHAQRRRWCELFCIFVMPFIFLLASFIITKIVDTQIHHKVPTRAQQEPLGGFPPYPFDVDSCAKYGSIGCQVAPFAPAIDVPGYDKVPVVFPYVGPDGNAGGGVSLGALSYRLCNPEESKQECEALAEAGPRERYGLFGNYTLQPFLYNGTNVSNYNNALLRMLSGGNSSTRYRDLVDAAQASPTPYIDNVYGLTVSSVGNGSTGQRELLSALYSSFYNSSRLVFPQYYGAYVFHDTASFPNVSATIYYNNTQLNLNYQGSALTTPANRFCYPDGNCQLISGVARLYDVIAKALGRPGVDNLLRVAPKVQGIQSGLNFAQLVAAVLIGLLLHFMMPTILRSLVFERESGIRQIMQMMGLRLSTYYLGTYIAFLLIYLIVMLSTIAFGWAFHVSFFTLNTPLLYFVGFFLWGNTMISFSMFLAPFLNDPTTALIFGWTYVVLIAFIGGQYLGQMFTYNAPSSLFLASFLLPSFSLFYMVYYAGGVNVGGQGLRISSDNSTVPGTNLGMCSGQSLVCYTFIYLAVEWLVLLLLGLYLDQVLPHRFTVRKHPLFFLGLKRHTRMEANVDLERAADKAASDPGVLAEAAAAATAAAARDPSVGVCVDRLVKVYPGRPPFAAVRGISLSLARGETFAILGQNGCGKSSAMNCMNGVHEITAGRVQILGLEVPSELGRVHLRMGVCPQFDLQWDELSGEEHLYFYARVKNVPRRQLHGVVDEALRSVNLEAPAVRRRVAGKYSGGMRRRLSVAMSMIGGSQVVILDEPSTGLDPQSRYELWECIQKRKAGRTILLTTHSMEEAERLADRVGVMDHGRMRAIGAPDELKLRYGHGYRLMVTTSEGGVAQMHQLIVERLSVMALPKSALDGHLVYDLPREELKLSQVFRVMESARRSGLVKDWSVSQATLEDVFVELSERS